MNGLTKSLFVVLLAIPAVVLAQAEDDAINSPEARVQDKDPELAAGIQAEEKQEEKQPESTPSANNELPGDASVGSEEDDKPETKGDKAPLPHEVVIDGLLDRLDSPDERTRIEAGIALRETAKLSDVPRLVKILKRGNNTDKQLFVVETLGRLEDREAGEALRFEVQHGEIVTQRAAITALGKLKFNWPIPVLVRTLRNAKDVELKKRAASALGEIGTPQAEYSLRTSLALLEETPGAKNAASWALEKIRGEVDDERIDTSMPVGQRLQIYYKGMRAFFYQPALRRGSSFAKSGLRPWLLVCVHDGDLRAEEVFNICWRAGKKRQMAVLAPYFDNMRFPNYGSFNIRGERADLRLMELIEHVGKHASLNVREFYLFGYGEGGDFAQRLTMTYPKRIARAAFESTEYTAPDPELYFPRGINRNPLTTDVGIDMYPFLKTDSVLILRKNSQTLRAGKEFFEAAQHYAEINGFRSRLALRNVDVKYEIWNEAEKYLFAFE